ncbi:hypothetical protein V2G26_008669 [Clonostachys chloroleuca]
MVHTNPILPCPVRGCRPGAISNSCWRQSSRSVPPRKLKSRRGLAGKDMEATTTHMTNGLYRTYVRLAHPIRNCKRTWSGALPTAGNGHKNQLGRISEQVPQQADGTIREAFTTRLFE